MPRLHATLSIKSKGKKSITFGAEMATWVIDRWQWVQTTKLHSGISYLDFFHSFSLFGHGCKSAEVYNSRRCNAFLDCPSAIILNQLGMKRLWSAFADSLDGISFLKLIHADIMEVIYRQCELVVTITPVMETIWTNIMYIYKHNIY